MYSPRARLQSIRFGSFELDLRAGELLREGVRIRLQEQSLQILAMLLEHPGPERSCVPNSGPADTLLILIMA